MKAVYLVVGLVILLASGAFFFFSRQQSSPLETTTSIPKEPTSNQQYVFENPKKSAHYESNTPSHGAILAGVPINVVIDFNFDLAKPSEIKIISNNQDYGVSETIIDQNKLAMRRNMDPNSPDGLYKVMYNACWPDGSCHDGSFQFVIDRSLSTGFSDMTNQKEITIKMSEIKFKPMDIKISKGTKVTWVNNDSVEHFINTDSHPAHTYYLKQNSKALKTGDTYSLTFDTPGIYPYHCSAHADNMVGNILVE